MQVPRTGIASRTGLGNVRGIAVSQMWLQEHVSNGRQIVNNVHGAYNLVDALTTHVGKESLIKHMPRVNGAVALGRHALSPEVDSGLVEYHNKE